MYQVKFFDAPVYEAKDIEPAILFALTLHRDSNLTHEISVVAGAGEKVITFYKGLELKK